MSMRRLTFAPYDPLEDNDTCHLFRDYRYKDHQLRWMGGPQVRMIEYLKKTLQEPGMQSFCMREGKRLKGLISLKALPWMSEHFGVRMYAVAHLLARGDTPQAHTRLLRYIIEELPDVDFLDCRIAVDDVASAHALETCGFRYVGTEVYLGQALQDRRPPDPPAGFEIRPFRSPRDHDPVLTLAAETHAHNRFIYDPHIGEQAARSLYRRLVANCFQQEQFSVFVACRDEKVQGFIISKTTPSFSREAGIPCGSLDFIGVRPETRNRGLGGALNEWALHDLARKGVTFVAVRTMASNYSALALCIRSGFRVTSTSLHFHKWVARPAMSSEVIPEGRPMPVRHWLSDAA